MASAKKWVSGGDLPRVTLATRALPASRALLNEAQIMAYITARWDVETVATTFDGALFDSMNLMRHSDVFLGMHGAGWTNSLFLSKASLSERMHAIDNDMRTRGRAYINSMDRNRIASTLDEEFTNMLVL